jgi:HTH-type transcriptional regulator / antitoxin HigA
MMPELKQVIHRWEAFSSIAQGFLNPISNEAEFEATEALLDEISDRMTSPNDPAYSAFSRLLMERIAVWEEQHMPMPEVTPQQTLKFLMEQHNLKQTDLSELVNQSTLSKILRGEREISKALAASLAKYFQTSKEVFL